jgi:hypothetical protein
MRNQAFIFNLYFPAGRQAMRRQSWVAPIPASPYSMISYLSESMSIQALPLPVKAKPVSGHWVPFGMTQVMECWVQSVVPLFAI